MSAFLGLLRAPCSGILRALRGDLQMGHSGLLRALRGDLQKGHSGLLRALRGDLQKGMHTAQWPLESQLIILVLILRNEEFVLFKKGGHSPTEQRLSFKNISDSREAEATHFLSCWLLNPSYWLHVTQFFLSFPVVGKKFKTFNLESFSPENFFKAIYLYCVAELEIALTRFLTF